MWNVAAGLVFEVKLLRNRVCDLYKKDSSPNFKLLDCSVLLLSLPAHSCMPPRDLLGYKSVANSSGTFEESISWVHWVGT